MINDLPTVQSAFGTAWEIDLIACGVGGFFWLMVLTTFEERRITPLVLAPALMPILFGGPRPFLSPGVSDALWWPQNLINGLLALHACVIIVRGWSGDLLEGRRRLRGLVMGAAAVFALSNATVLALSCLDPTGPWVLFSGGRLYGGAFISLASVATATMFVQMRVTIGGAPRRSTAVPDPRVEAVERQILSKLDALMVADVWREEGLTIGELARRLEAPEHHVRRLINQRLGYRNFADFVNGFRIEAAKRRLADPAEARMTVAAIAFDLGYGSLSPFNRAFRTATGSTPTEWRRAALQSSSDLQEAV